MKILVVEDTAPIAKAFKKILENDGHSVEVAGNGEDALEILNEATFDLMFVDLMLPGMQGDELIREIYLRKIETPIVVTTNMGVGYDEQQLKKHGAREVLLKSRIGPAELRALADKHGNELAN